MREPRLSKAARRARKTDCLAVRPDREGRALLAEAARGRQMSVGEYVRAVAVPQARREVAGARGRVLTLTPEEQMVFWAALDEPPTLTDAQRAMGCLMREES